MFRELGAAPPVRLTTIYKSFLDDAEMAAMLALAAVPVVSFHFGLPSADQVAALKRAGSVLFATATSLTEALAANGAGMDAFVAQGWEAGGHRGMFIVLAIRPPSKATPAASHGGKRVVTVIGDPRRRPALLGQGRASPSRPGSAR